jgi:hypothetical protein
MSRRMSWRCSSRGAAAAAGIHTAAAATVMHLVAAAAATGVRVSVCWQAVACSRRGEMVSGSRAGVGGAAEFGLLSGRAARGTPGCVCAHARVSQLLGGEGSRGWDGSWALGLHVVRRVVECLVVKSGQFTDPSLSAVDSVVTALAQLQRAGLVCLCGQRHVCQEHSCGVIEAGCVLTVLPALQGQSVGCACVYWWRGYLEAAGGGVWPFLLFMQHCWQASC